MNLPPDQRSAWIADASQHLRDRADERHHRIAAWHAAGADPATHPDRSSTRPLEPAARQLDRRRTAAARCRPLDDGRRDPHSLTRGDEPIGVGELDSWARALAHLQTVGLVGLPPAPVRRALAAFPERYSDVLPGRPVA